MNSSVKFTWTFTGNPGVIEWGIKGADDNAFETNGKILTLTSGAQTFINPAYDGRVSGNSQSGQVVFTLKAITRNDVKSYLCILRSGFGGSDKFDHVELIVEGNYDLKLHLL